MTTATDRRQFVQRGAASLILGFPILSEASGQTAEVLAYPRLVYQGLLGRAMKRMADECKPGVVFLIRPDQHNLMLSQSLAGLLVDTGADTKRLFGQAIFVCVPLAEVQAVLPAKNDSIAMLLDPKGRPVDQLRQQPWPFENATLHLTRFLHGPERKLLAEFAEAQRLAIGNEERAAVDIALRKLSADEFRVRHDAMRQLIEKAPRISAILAEAHQRGDEETRYRIDLVFDRYYLSLPEAAGQRMPFGVEWFEQPFDSCPGCGRFAFNGPAVQRAVKTIRWTQK